MNRNISRILALALCAMLLCTMLPAQAGAVEWEPEASLSLPANPELNAIGDNGYGGYTFTTLEDLKVLAGRTYNSQTFANYVGEGPLVITENMTLPDNLILYAGGNTVHIPWYVTMNVGSCIRADNIIVDGTLIVSRGITIFKGMLTVNGTMVMNGWSIEIQSNIPIQGEDRIVYGNQYAQVLWCLYATNEQEFLSAVQMAHLYPKDRYLYSIAVHNGTVELNNDVVIPENAQVLVWNTGSLVISNGHTLTNYGGIFLYSTISVRGTLTNYSYIEIYYDNGARIFFRGSYGGFGFLYAISDALTEPDAAVPGLNLDECLVETYDGAWGIRWAADRFMDVWPGEYYYNAVKWAVDKEITTGLDDYSFGPEDACTRGQIVTFLWRAAGEPAPKSTRNPFTDVKPGDFYYTAVLWAVEQGITTGLNAKTFGPDVTCTRAQVATFLYRYYKEPDCSSSNPFKDVKKDQYYYDAVLWAVEEGVTTGLTAKTFGPDNTCTRGQIVTFLYRAIA